MGAENIVNPARWLLSLWDRLPRTNPVLQGPALAGWARAFGMDLSDGRIFSVLHSLQSNVESTIKLVEKLNASADRKQKLLRWSFAFSEANSDLINSRGWNSVVGRFTPDRRMSLDFCVTELDEAMGANARSSDDLARLIQNIEELQAKLSEDDRLEPVFKEFMHDMFEAIRRACSEYKIRGPQGMLDAMAYILAGLHRYSGDFNSPEKAHWKSKLKDSLSVASDIVTVTGVSALGATQLLASFS